MDIARTDDDWRRARIENWLFLILRFAISRTHEHAEAAVAAARALDHVDGSLSAHTTFFARTTEVVHGAISNTDGPTSRRVLQTHLLRIENARLKGAFAAALELEGSTHKPSAAERKRLKARTDLWKGLRGPGIRRRNGDPRI